MEPGPAVDSLAEATRQPVPRVVCHCLLLPGSPKQRERPDDRLTVEGYKGLAEPYPGVRNPWTDSTRFRARVSQREREESPRPLTVFTSHAPATESRKTHKGLLDSRRPLHHLSRCPLSRRRRWDLNPRMGVLQTPALPLGYVAKRSCQLSALSGQPEPPASQVRLRADSCGLTASESGRWDSNPRPSPWQGDVLPLNYTRR